MSSPRVFVVADLPVSPLDAALAFHAEHLPAMREQLAAGQDAIIAFAPADHTHASWRLAAVQELAREAAPARVNAVVGRAGAAMEETCRFIASLPGITGQIFTLDGNSPQNG